MAFALPDWSAAALDDPRLRERLRLVAADLQARPGASLPEACRSKAALKGAYRFFDHPRATADAILPAFVRPSVAALASRREVLVVHDTTTFNFSSLESASGLGYINDSRSAQGIHLHSSLLLDEDCRLVGIGDLRFWVRDGFREETPQQVRDLPIEEKESFRWLLGMRAVRAAFDAAAQGGKTPRLIHVMDREGDIHEVFQDVRAAGDHAVIRCAQDRRVEGEEEGVLACAKGRVAAQVALGTMELRVPLKDGGWRMATVEVRSLGVVLRPDGKKHKGRRALRLGLVEVREVSVPPEGEKAALWLLWTTLRVGTLAQVRRVLGIYRARWRIEDYHRAMKTGCAAEKLRLQDGRKLMKALAVKAWVATRIVRLRDEGKDAPEQDGGRHFSEAEWKLLWAEHHGRAWREGDGKPTLGEALRWLGRLGGHLGRKNDPMPGAECLAKALQALEMMMRGREIGRLEAGAGPPEPSPPGGQAGQG